MDRAVRIRELNDRFRTTFQGGRILVTASVRALGSAIEVEALSRVRKFAAFSEGNDPHAEHDFGAFEIEGRKFFWKIDCYDETGEFGSEDPADPGKTLRVLTIMLAEDY